VRCWLQNARCVDDACFFTEFRRDAIPPMGEKNTEGGACALLSTVGPFVKNKSLKTGRCPGLEPSSPPLTVSRFGWFPGPPGRVSGRRRSCHHQPHPQSVGEGRADLTCRRQRLLFSSFAGRRPGYWAGIPPDFRPAMARLRTTRHLLSAYRSAVRGPGIGGGVQVLPTCNGPAMPKENAHP